MVLLKGVKCICIVLCYVLFNVIGLIVNVVVLSLFYLLGGVFIVESIFNYFGIVIFMIDVVIICDMLLV